MAVKRVNASGTARSKVGQNFKKQTTEDNIASMHIKSCEDDNFDTPGSTAMLEPCQNEKIVDTCGMIASIPIVKAPDKRQYPARTQVHAAEGLAPVNFSSN
jgi:hypothetical protein